MKKETSWKVPTAEIISKLPSIKSIQRTVSIFSSEFNVPDSASCISEEVEGVHISGAYYIKLREHLLNRFGVTVDVRPVSMISANLVDKKPRNFNRLTLQVMENDSYFKPLSSEVEKAVREWILVNPVYRAGKTPMYQAGKFYIASRKNSNGQFPITNVILVTSTEKTMM